MSFQYITEITSKYDGDVVSRHNRIRDILGVKVEVGNNLFLSRDPQQDPSGRHASYFPCNWFLGRTAALDVSIISPLNPITLLEVGVSTTAGPDHWVKEAPSQQPYMFIGVCP